MIILNIHLNHVLKNLNFCHLCIQLQQLISEPTRVTNTSATLIDLIFTNDSNNIAKSGVIYNGMV